MALIYTLRVLIIAGSCIFLRKLIMVHEIIALVVQIIKNINRVGTSRLLNNCGVVHLMGWDIKVTK